VATLDGGIHHLLRPALLGVPHPARLIAGDGRRLGRTTPVMLAGPLCTSLDTLDAAAPLPMPRPGDLVVFLHAGAYGFTQSMPLFSRTSGRPSSAAAAPQCMRCVARPASPSFAGSSRFPRGSASPGSLGHSAVNSAQPAKEIASNGSSTGDCPGSERNCRNAGPAR
jgi:hypothetical protein